MGFNSQRLISFESMDSDEAKENVKRAFFDWVLECGEGAMIYIRKPLTCYQDKNYATGVTTYCWTMRVALLRGDSSDTAMVPHEVSIG